MPGRATTTYDLTVAELEQQNPILNPDSPAFDPIITAAVVGRRDEYVRAGMDMTEAIRKAVLELRTAQAAEERAARDAAARAEQNYYVEQDRRQQQLLAAQDEAYRAAARRREEEAAVAAAMAQQERYAKQIQTVDTPRQTNQRRQAGPTASLGATNLSSTGSRGAINVVTGEYMAPAGPNVVSTRDGTLYVGAGPNGYVNSRTGQFIPAH